MTTHLLPEAHTPRCGAGWHAVGIPQARGGEGANALAAVIKFGRTRAALLPSRQQTTSVIIREGVGALALASRVSVRPRRAEEVFQL